MVASNELLEYRFFLFRIQVVSGKIPDIYHTPSKPTVQSSDNGLLIGPASNPVFTTEHCEFASAGLAISTKFCKSRSAIFFSSSVFLPSGGSRHFVFQGLGNSILVRVDIRVIRIFCQMPSNRLAKVYNGNFHFACPGKSLASDEAIYGRNSMRKGIEQYFVQVLDHARKDTGRKVCPRREELHNFSRVIAGRP